ncbi:MAG TPA: MFS transporter, partial [Acidimicrobiales bacterium]|nr:MFS transporter [Acidimicrobiales bacterium]
MPSTTTLERRRGGSAAPAASGESARSGRLSSPSVLLAVILTAQLMVVLDATIVNVALPHIQRGLHFTSSSLSWVLNAYVLAFGGLLLLGARAGDLIGRRRTFLIGIAVFAASSLVGGFAVTGPMLLASRALQGVGAAMAAPSSLALLTSIFPEGPARMRAIAMFTTVSAAGGAIGLVSGGLLTQWASWRYVMFVNVPIGLAVLALGRVVLHETPTRHGRFDLVGAVTSTLGTTGVVLGLVEAGSSGWSAPITVVSFVAGVVLLAAFVVTERTAEEPVLPLRLLTDPARSTANVARGLVYAGMYGSFFFLSQFLQNVDGYSPLRAGVSFLPVPLSVFASSQLTSRVLVKRLSAKVVMLSGITLATLSLALSTRITTGSGYPQILGILVLLGIGSGISLVSLTSASLAGVAPADAGAASGLTNVVQQLGAALGLAVLVTVFDVATHHAGAAALARMAAAQREALVVHGLHDVFLVGSGLAVSAFAFVAAIIKSAPRPVKLPV